MLPLAFSIRNITIEEFHTLGKSAPGDVFDYL